MKSKRVGFKAVSLLGLLVSPVSAEVTEYRLGHLIEGLIDVLGFNFLDLTSALPTIIFLGLLLTAVLSVRWLWSKF